MTDQSLAPSDLEAALEGSWVVIILDPDWDGWSPYSVVANDIGSAVARAVNDWEADQSDPEGGDPYTEPTDDYLKPHIMKVYRASAITEIAWDERSRGGLGSFDMSKLANPR